MATIRTTAARHNRSTTILILAVGLATAILASACGTNSTGTTTDTSTTSSADKSVTDTTETTTTTEPEVRLPFGYKAVDATECSSKGKWILGSKGSSLMHPGRDCVDCHKTERGAPDLGFGGTVFGALDEADDCIGVTGYKVVVVDDTGAEFNATVNSAGNFYLRSNRFGDAVTPLTARIELDGEVVAEMTDAVPHGQCNLCHSATGANEADGRIIIP